MTKVKIKNFQSIGDAEFDVDGFTVIVGKNNIGKSAVIRAIEAALTNKIGKGDIRKDKKFTEIKIKRDDIDIEWKKGDKTFYKIETVKDGKPVTEEFSALAGALPKPMIDAGFDKMETGETKPMSPLVASQFHELFLVDKVGSVVTEVISKLYNIDTLNEADNLCQKELKANKSQLKGREADLKTLQENLEKFRDFENLKRVVEGLVKEENTCRRLQEEISALVGYEDRLATLQDSVKRLAGIKSIKIPDSIACAELSVGLGWIEIKETELKTVATTVKKLQGIKTVSLPETGKTEEAIDEFLKISHWEKTQTELVSEIKVLKTRFDSFNLNELNSMTLKLSEVLEDFKTVSLMHENFYAVATATKSVRDELKRVVEEYEQAEKDRSQIKVCPACERPFQ